MDKYDLICGFTIPEILEMKRFVEKEGKANLIKENATLRAKVSFYESRVQEMNKFMYTNLEIK